MRTTGEAGPLAETFLKLCEYLRFHERIEGGGGSSSIHISASRYIKRVAIPFDVLASHPGRDASRPVTMPS